MMDENELLPFCTRCFGIGAAAGEEAYQNFCHQCGSQNTCIPVKRKDVYSIQKSLDVRIQDAYKYTQEKCKKDTIEHISQVRHFMLNCISELAERAVAHDQSKLESPEIEIFTEYTPKLKESTYGSEEYKSFLEGMSVALKHHYENNSHHPEHYKKYVCNGCFEEYIVMPDRCKCGFTQFQAESDISQMDLFDLMEMLCDWKAATMRHANGDIYKSLEINKDRFRINDQLYHILRNTVRAF